MFLGGGCSPVSFFSHWDYLLCLVCEIGVREGCTSVLFRVGLTTPFSSQIYVLCLWNQFNAKKILYLWKEFVCVKINFVLAEIFCACAKKICLWGHYLRVCRTILFMWKEFVCVKTNFVLAEIFCACAKKICLWGHDLCVCRMILYPWKEFVWENKLCTCRDILCTCETTFVHRDLVWSSSPIQFGRNFTSATSIVRVQHWMYKLQIFFTSTNYGNVLTFLKSQSAILARVWQGFWRANQHIAPPAD